MARRRKSSSRLLVPEASRNMEQFKSNVMGQYGYSVNENEPQNVKYEVAKALGIPLSKEGNGNLTTEQAGKIGGQIGGTMVREMIRMAQQKLTQGRN